MGAPGPGGERARALPRALICLLLVSNPVCATAPARIASLNLCTDSMLLELMPAPNRVSLTHLAQQLPLSPRLRTAQVSINHGLAEELVAFGPDLILSGESTSQATSALLTRLGFRVVHFPSAHTLSAFRRSFRRLGRLLERETDVEALLAGMAQRIEALGTPRGNGESALLLSGGGYVSGPETLADDLLASAGLRNAASNFRLADGGFLSLERLLVMPPQWLLIDSASAMPTLASEYLHHPALRAVADAHLIAVPETLWACGGTYFADAVAMIARGLQRARATTP